MLDTDIIYGPFGTLILVIISTVLFYWYSTQNFDYWEKRNVPFVTPLPFVGSALEILRKPLKEIDQERYKRLGHVYGAFEGNRPVLNVADVELIRDILIKDFHIFPERKAVISKDPAVSAVLIDLVGEDWKRVRAIVTPLFSSGKLKRMISIFKDCSKTVIQNFDKSVKKTEPVDLKRAFRAYTMDVIATAAFSTKLDTLNDPQNEFVKHVDLIHNPTSYWRILMHLVFPKLVKTFGIVKNDPTAYDFFRNISLNIIAQRKSTGEKRNDFLQLLLDITKDSKSELAETESKDIPSFLDEVSTDHQVFKHVSKKELSVNEMIGQCINFFIAYDTAAVTLIFVLYHLALHEEVQEKVFKEIHAAITEANGEVTHESLQSMKYMDCVILETMRIYPPAVRINRVAAADYKLGTTGIIVPKGMTVNIPIYSIQRDPSNFPDPEKFYPERFNPENKTQREDYAYLPFGKGPRNCVGMRFALIEMKVCLAYILANFQIRKCSKTKVPLEFTKGIGLLNPKDAYVSLELRKQNPIMK